MKLGNLRLNSFLFLAPMSGITNYPFRKLAREKGCGLTFTEMVSADGLLRRKEPLLSIGKDEHPLSVQLFGSNPEVLARAAGIAEAMGADAIDINMGCPSRHVTGTGAGADLVRFPEKVQRILVEVRKEVKCPLTIKIRSGWDGNRINAVEISQIAEDCGVDAIAIHPRTKVQGFAGQADWTLIGEVKKAIHIPVIGNGDVTTPLSAKRMIKETGCDGVMIGRGALGNPWIFHPGGRTAIHPSLKERRQVIEYHFSLLETYCGEERAAREIRKHLIWYTKGLPFSVSFRSALSQIRERNTFFEAIASYFSRLDKHVSASSTVSNPFTRP